MIVVISKLVVASKFVKLTKATLNSKAKPDFDRLVLQWSRLIVVENVEMVLSYVYTQRFRYRGACYVRTKVTKCIREKMTLYFCG